MKFLNFLLSIKDFSDEVADRLGCLAILFCYFACFYSIYTIIIILLGF